MSEKIFSELILEYVQTLVNAYEADEVTGLRFAIFEAGKLTAHVLGREAAMLAALEATEKEAVQWKELIPEMLYTFQEEVLTCDGSLESKQKILANIERWRREIE